jgi:hypothetical protein
MFKVINKTQAEKVIGGALSGEGSVTLPNGNNISGSAQVGKSGADGTPTTGKGA